MAGSQRADQLRDRTFSSSWRSGGMARGCWTRSIHGQWPFLPLLLTWSAKFGLPQVSPYQEGKRYDKTGVFATFSPPGMLEFWELSGEKATCTRGGGLWPGGQALPSDTGKVSLEASVGETTLTWRGTCPQQGVDFTAVTLTRKWKTKGPFPLCFIPNSPGGNI